MGQKVNPKIFRTGVIRTWNSKWFCDDKKMILNIQQDTRTRKFIISEFKEAGVDRVEIERSTNKIAVNIFTAKPGLIIGRGGTGAEDLKKKLHTKFLKTFRINDISLNISEVDRPNLSSQILVQSMILEIEKRMPFRRVMKQAMARAERAGALGVKVIIKGRLNGAEIARSEMLTTGSVPLHTLRADIDYSRGTARTLYGAIGIRAYIYRGEVFSKEEEKKGQVLGNNKGKR